MKKLLFLAALCYIAGATSCVSNKKYLAARDRAHRDSVLLANTLANRDARIRDLEGNVGNLSNKVDQIQQSNEMANSQLNQSQEEIAKQRERLAQLQASIDQQRKNTEALRAKMANALQGFTSDQLGVSIKNGRVYVSMQESLLFPSGSAEVNPKGREALGTIAQALNGNPDINIRVEGHTDSIAIHTAKYEDNWSLSVARATSIARIMMTNYGVAPARITASGRSQYEPIDNNATPEGRARNRRTEIILEPKLSELMKLIEG